MAARSGLTAEIVDELLREGWTQNRIAAEYGVSRQYVSKLKKLLPSYHRTPRQIVMDSYPWNTGERFHDSKRNRIMRDHAEYMATGGKGMSQEKLTRLAWFYRFLSEHNKVLEFDPNIPPSDGDGSPRYENDQDFYGGFAFRDRKDSDGDLIIRVNAYTNLTEQGRVIFRMPPVLPEIS